ncbi:plastocyanin/azurin family copper-binding protein [Paraburkholderia sacchari]|uniref:plastocyanin/azurin family copper-binding protein n=1 Tax=Paraburkholderia sacchari TaxID=159450 RepID=UPI003D99A972
MHATHRIAIIAIMLASGMTPRASWAQQTVNATLLSDSIQLETHSVKAGRLTLDIRNDANNTVAHELVVLKTNLPDDALPARKGQVLEHKLKKIGEIEDVAPGKSKRASFTLAPGHYVLICNKPGHYAMGMHTVLVVTP